MEKEKPREMEWLTWGHTAGKWKELEPNLGVHSPKPVLLITEHCGCLSGRKSRHFYVKIVELKFWFFYLIIVPPWSNYLVFWTSENCNKLLWNAWLVCVNTWVMLVLVGAFFLLHPSSIPLSLYPAVSYLMKH